MMASLLVGLVMMVSVTVELILRQVVALAGEAARLPAIPFSETVGAE
jgi:hypothetical protein